MRAVVTGCAGFIGSTLVDALLARGDEVLGIDCFSLYYEPRTKWANILGALAAPSFELVEADLRSAELVGPLEGADAVFHLAAQPGVRLSWSSEFAEYDSANVLATQRVLDAAVRAGVPRLVYASSSSVYGRAAGHPTTEDELPRPSSPYGVTKLAAEHLCGLYAANRGLPTVALRYFSVYGPRQRPDMAIHRILEAGLRGETFCVYGDGSAGRDFTFVADVVGANLAAAAADVAPGTVVNVAGGTATTISALLDLAGTILGTPINADHQPEEPGAVRDTRGAIDKAERLLGWIPTVALRDGLLAQAAWHRSR